MPIIGPEGHYKLLIDFDKMVRTKDNINIKSFEDQFKSNGKVNLTCNEARLFKYALEDILFRTKLNIYKIKKCKLNDKGKDCAKPLEYITKLMNKINKKTKSKIKHEIESQKVDYADEAKEEDDVIIASVNKNFKKIINFIDSTQVIFKPDIPIFIHKIHINDSLEETVFIPELFTNYIKE